MHPRGVNPPPGSRYYARRPSDPADEPPFRCHGKLRQGRKSILQEGFAVTLDYAIAGAVSMDNRHRGGGADGEGKGTLPPAPCLMRLPLNGFRWNTPTARPPMATV